MNALITEHKLDFEAAPWRTPEWTRFRIGTCEGLWTATPTEYQILAVVNNQPGNGHFTDVLQWFEFSCKRDKKNLRICEVWNKKFLAHLIKKRGFKQSGKEDAIKKFKNTSPTPNQ